MSRVVALGGFVMTMLLGWSAAAQVDCDALHVEGQQLQKQGQLGGARAKFQACAQELSCDQLVRDRCEEKRAAADVAMPTVLLVVHGADGAETLAFTLSIEGQPFGGRLDQPIELDPGARTLQIAIGDQQRDAQIVLREGEKNRRIEVTFVAEAPPAPLPIAEPVPQPVPAPLPPPVDDDGLTGLQIGGIVLGVVGVIGIGVGAGLGGLAITKNNAAVDACEGDKSQCEAESVNDARSDLMIARELRNGSVAGLLIGGAMSVAGLTMLLAGGSDDGEGRAGLTVDIGVGYAGLRLPW